MPFVEISGKQWFHEANSQWPGIALTLEVEAVLEDFHSDYQHVQVFKSTTFGVVLILDDVIQYTEKDECSYQESIAHTPLFSHPNPQTVFVVGAGDGGVLREIEKHASVTEIVICEIDDKVIEMGKKYFDMEKVWADPRVTLHRGDAAKFVERAENKEKFDVVISDTSDPIGPAAALFEMPFYTSLHAAMKPGGLLSTQAESMWVHQDIIAKLVKGTSAIFEHVAYSTCQIPTYPCGQIGVLQLMKKYEDKATSVEEFKSSRPVPENMALKYYSQEMHASRYVLPRFIKEIIDEAEPSAKRAKTK